RRVRRPAGRAHGRAAQPLGPVPGAEGARPGAEEKTVEAAERDREDVAEARAAWRAGLAGIDPARLIFIDETGIDTRMTRAHARAARGQRATGKVPWGRWERLTVLGALALDGHGPDRAGLVQAQGGAADGRRPLEGGAGGRPRPGARHHHRPGRAGLVPPRRLPGRGLTCNPL